jgi:DNA topoisomerase-3
MIFSSVAGHLLQLEFESPYDKWHGCTPSDLYTAPVYKQVSKGEGEKIKRNLQTLARRAQWLVLWLDCDREGENIAFEVIQVCLEVNPNLVVKRARFSALISRDIFHAVNNLVAPNANESAAVDARQEIDLRIGSSFTRLQTLLLQDAFNWQAHLQEGRERMLLSYGPCQFPTLGLIVQREWEIQAHVSEPFWTIKVDYRSPPNVVPIERCEFAWQRGRLFDQFTSEMYYDMCMQNPTATVRSVEGQQRTRRAPVPLCTLEMQKKASQSLRLSGERIMKIAEELYQGGYISYPRTETNQFAQGYDLLGLVGQQAEGNAPWAAFAQRLTQGNQFRWPMSGNKDDGAHPPIHPTRSFAGDNGEKGKLYEFIVRHFLACCAPDAQGQETRVAIEIAGEGFSATGLMVTARNWLDVYPYTNWGGEGALPLFQQGQTFQPQEIKLHNGATQPPPRMRESDLLAKMDTYGIGTDATVADHIAKQLERGYAVKDNGNQTFAPTPLGESLISAYKKMGLENLWMPTLRGIIERNITAVARGQRSKEEVLHEAIEAFSNDFLAAARKAVVLQQEVRDIVFPTAGNANGANGANGAMNNGNGNIDASGGFVFNAGGGMGGAIPTNAQSLGPCPSCGTAQMLFIPAQDNRGPIVRCSTHSMVHDVRREFPSRVTQAVSVSEEDVCACGRKKLRISFSRALLPPQFQDMAEVVSCVACDRRLGELLTVVGPARAPPRQQQQHAGGRGGGRAGGRSSGGGGSGTSRGGRGGRSASGSRGGRSTSESGRARGGAAAGRRGRGRN